MKAKVPPPVQWAVVAVVVGFIALDPLALHSVDDWLRGLGGSGSVAHESHAEQDAAELWTCPMHPEVLRDEPGQCPICGMDLVKASTTAASPGHAATSTQPAATDGLHTCGMHPQVLQDGPGQCPICGMDLTPMVAAAEPTEDAWACPLHPEITSDLPGPCPVCGTEMEPAAGGPIVTLQPAVVQEMNVVTEPARRRTLHRRIRTVGYLTYDQERMVTVTTKYSGFVEKVHVNYVGEPVEQGDPLFDVYSPELVQTEQELLSALRYADGLENASPETHARAQALVEAARTRLSYWDISSRQIAELERTGQVFRTLTVVSPSRGVVMRRMDGLEGAAVRPAMEAMHIVDLENLWLTVEVFENQLAWVDIGSPAEITLSYFPGATFTGKVRYIEPEVSEKTRAARLTLEVPNPDGRLRVNMYATVDFEPVVAPEAITVSAQAVIRTGERNLVVQSLGGGRFVPRRVELGHEGEGYVEILDGLSDRDQVVTSAQFLIDSESNLQAAIQKLMAGHGH